MVMETQGGASIRQAEIRDQVVSQKILLDELEKRMENLLQRLGPVMKPMIASPREESKEVGLATEYGEKLRISNRRICAAEACLGQIFNLLEI